MISFEEFLASVGDWFLSTGVKVLVALILLMVSFRAITMISRRVEKRLINGKRRMDKTLTTTLFYILRILFKFIAVICVVGYLGIDTSGLAALITSLGVGVGLAVNGALSNLAGGALIIITRPFKIDDFIEAQGYSGTVEDIHITATRIRTPDNKVIYIPNGTLSSDTIVNYSEKETRRVDLNFSVDYSTDIEYAKSLVMSVIEENRYALADPEPFVRVSEHGASGITISTRVWVKNTDYWAVHFDVLEGVKAAFDKNGITIPYSQLDVHIKKE